MKVSVRKISVLGMVLMAASAVTAAVLPKTSSDSRQDNSANDATLVSDSGVGGGGAPLSCVPDNTQNFSCNISTATVTTGTGVLSDNIANNTNNNTSLSDSLNANDTTSADQ